MRTFLAVSLVEIAAIPLLPIAIMHRDALSAYTKNYGFLSINLAALCLLVFGVAWTVRRIIDQAFAQLETELATNRAMKDGLEAKVLERTAELSAARDAAEVANRAKGDFLANMSHEIRTPLHGMLGMVDLLIEAPLPPNAQDKLKVVSESGNHLMGIITDILEFSRIDEGKVEFHAEAIQLKPFLQGIAEPMALLARSKGIELALWTAPDLPDCIEMDGLRLRQVLTNLLGNGIKFTHRGEVRLVAEVSEGRLRFQVQDTGEGMERSVLMRIFERFSQADSSITRRFGGTGLGLSISKSLSEGMGGTLEVFSEPGKGSSFVVTFPLTPCSSRDSSASDSSSAGRAEQGELEGMRILLVDDNPVNRKVAEGILAKGKCMVAMAEHGRMALTMLSRIRYDLVLMDCQMPVMDGFEAARMIRSWKDSPDEKLRSASDIPVIGLTADVSRQAREECLAAGMDSVLTKPFKATALREAIRDQLP